MSAPKTAPHTFAMIIWGYHKQLFQFSAIENYHLHALAVAKELGYELEAYLINAHVRMEDDPNFDPAIKTTYHRGNLGLIRFLWKHRNSIVYANTVFWQNFVFVPLICRFAIFMAGDSIKRRSAIKQWIETTALRGYWRVRLVSPGEKTFLLSQGVPAKKCFVAPMPLDTKLFTPAHTPGIGLVFLGNVTPDNDFPTILAAVADVAERYPDVVLNIIGEIRIPEFHDLVAKHGIEKNIVLHGQKTHAEIAQLLPTFAVSVSTVISSGQHLSIYESALSGLSLCIPDTMQFNTVFQDFAHFHPLYDSAKLAQNIRDCLADPTAARERALACAAFVCAEYSAEALTPKMRALFTFD